MGNLIPGEKIIYERVGRKIFARYPNKPNIPRWVIGEQDAPSVLGYDDWKKMLELCDTNPAFKKEFDKLVNLYYLMKDDS